MREKMLTVWCNQVGRLMLVGVLDQTATFIAVSLRILDPYVFWRHMEGSFKSAFVTEPIDNARQVATVIFQCELESEIRNPKGLLLAVRRKLNQVIKNAEAECLHQQPEEDLSNPFGDDDCPECGCASHDGPCDIGTQEDAATDFIHHGPPPAGAVVLPEDECDDSV